MNEPDSATYIVQVICERCGELIYQSRHHATDLNFASIPATEHEAHHRDG